MADPMECEAPATRFLASVREVDEVETVLGAGADIVDLKDPAKGALGAVERPIAAACVAKVGGRVPVSATVGDLPMDPALVTAAVVAMAASGVDDVKLGIAPDGDPLRCLAALRDLRTEAGLILVFFADLMPDFDPVDAARIAGARGIMLDTARKGAGSLTDHMALDHVAHFVDEARHAGLMVGVAGSLRSEHVGPLLSLRPDVMGFRGALCHGARRAESLDPAACRRIRAMIPGHPERAGSVSASLAPSLCARASA